MTYLDPPFPLAQSTEFEMGAIFCVDARIDGDDFCLESDDAFSEMHDLDEIFEGGSCVDAMAAVSSSPDLTDHVSLNPLDISLASSCSLPPLPLSIVISHRLTLLRCSRGMWLTVLSP